MQSSIESTYYIYLHTSYICLFEMDAALTYLNTNKNAAFGQSLWRPHNHHTTCSTNFTSHMRERFRPIGAATLYTRRPFTRVRRKRSGKICVKDYACGQ